MSPLPTRLERTDRRPTDPASRRGLRPPTNSTPELDGHHPALAYVAEAKARPVSVWPFFPIEGLTGDIIEDVIHAPRPDLALAGGERRVCHWRSSHLRTC